MTGIDAAEVVSRGVDVYAVTVGAAVLVVASIAATVVKRRLDHAEGAGEPIGLVALLMVANIMQLMGVIFIVSGLLT